MGNSPERGGGGGGGGVAKFLGSNQRIVIPTVAAVFVLVGLPILIWSSHTSAICNHFRPITYPVIASVPDGNNVSQTRAPDLHNLSVPLLPILPLLTTTPTWVSVELEPNYTSTLLARWLAPGGQPCRDRQTSNISISGLDGHNSPIKLAAGEIHEFVISALDEFGRPRCLGGDYFETDLSGDLWKSRPPVKDHGNGSYSFYLQVHHDFTGTYNLTVVLLFRRFEGLKLSPIKFAFRKELRRTSIRFYKTGNVSSLPELRLCDARDFSREVWSGRWTRHERKKNCPIDNDGRYRCLDINLPCRNPWCHGPVGSLESNGWVYSAHCSFQIFKQKEAWKCLRGRWLFFWGDSNHVDTIRNVLNFVLGLWEIKSVPRRFDMNFTNPWNASESVRITSIFNGHWNETRNYEGLNSLRNKRFRDLLWRYFSEDGAPDTLILNSGLHDGVRWTSIRGFNKAADYAACFWEDIFRQLKEKGKRLPSVFYRTTIATGGYARDLAFNPSKMETFNNIILEKLKKKGLLGNGGGVVDEFDMTFPWHYDNRCNDGVHYGRAPAKAKWKDGEIGHQYFVDLMLGHVLLNAICGSSRRQ